MAKFKGILKLSYIVEANNPREAIAKINHLINEEAEDGFKTKIIVQEVI